jgi:hypothetical protein
MFFLMNFVVLLLLLDDRDRVPMVSNGCGEGAFMKNEVVELEDTCLR